MQVLQKRLGEPLATVQTLLQKDKVVWEQGLLSTPPVRIRHGLQLCDVCNLRPWSMKTLTLYSHSAHSTATTTRA